MAKSKSQTKRENVQKQAQSKPDWTKHQQKETKAKNSEDRQAERKPESKLVKLKMKTNYRHFAKKGDVWETDAAKAEELVNLGRAEYAK